MTTRYLPFGGIGESDMGKYYKKTPEANVKYRFI